MKIFFSDFIRFILAGTPVSRINCLAEAKHRPGYHPGKDYWGEFRNSVIRAHKEEQSPRSLDELPELVSPKRMSNYMEAVASYKQWWGRKKIEWFEPQTQLFEDQGVEIRVNPELGLRINGRPHLVKLYCRREKLSGQQAKVALMVMGLALENLFPETKMSILHVHEGRLLSGAVCNERLATALKGDLSYISTVWPGL